MSTPLTVSPRINLSLWCNSFSIYIIWFGKYYIFFGEFSFILPWTMEPRPAGHRCNQNVSRALCTRLYWVGSLTSDKSTSHHPSHPNILYCSSLVLFALSLSLAYIFQPNWKLFERRNRLRYKISLNLAMSFFSLRKSGTYWLLTTTKIDWLHYRLNHHDDQ